MSILSKVQSNFALHFACFLSFYKTQCIIKLRTNNNQKATLQTINKDTHYPTVFIELYPYPAFYVADMLRHFFDTNCNHVCVFWP